MVFEGESERARLAANKAVVERYFEEVLNGHDVAAMRELVAPNADGNQCGGALFRGRDEWEQRTKEVFEAFPDIHVTIEEMIAEGDLVAVRSLGTATQERALADIARTGNRVQLRNFDMFRVENGRITFADSHPDTLGVLRQLGQVEVPPAFARLIELPQPPTA